MSTIKKIDVGSDFHHRLANRDEKQGDGKFTAVEFRTKYLSIFDNKEVWDNNETLIILDFANVTKLGPSFANEAFAYFTRYAKPNRILEKIQLKNISDVKLLIIKEELESGYKPLWQKFFKT